MSWQKTLRYALPVGMALFCLALTPSAFGQFAGVYVDANGVLHTRVIPDPGGQLHRARVAAAQASLEADLQAKTALRKISLNRLEKAIEKCIEEGRQPSAEMLHLAGLKRIKYVFFYPESKDIVIAGPAEGWFTDPAGRARAMSDGKPVLLLEDLVVALRTYPPNEKKKPVVGCSIDPTQQGLQRMQQFLARVGASATPNQTQFIVKGLRQSLGLQTVSVMGVPASTHFAQVMVEADYRMKLIGIGLERPPVKMASYVDLVNPAAVARNAMQRWYFTPNYEAVKVTEDRTAMELVGNGVKLIGEDELVSQNGQRAAAGTTNKASERFVKGFTQKYPDLAEKSPVYAQLRNLIDMLIAASFIQQEGYYDKADWNMIVFGNEKLFEVEKHDVPAKVESAVNSIWKGRTLMTPIGGGVEISAHQALDPSRLMSDEDGQLKSTREKVGVNLAKGQWWWD